MPTPRTVPNQKVVKINKEPCDRTHYYTSINLNALQHAMNDFKDVPKQFWVWLYLTKNRSGNEFALSSRDVQDWGISEHTFHRAIEFMIENDYLIREGDHSNRYTFYEMPQQGITNKGRDFSEDTKVDRVMLNPITREVKPISEEEHKVILAKQKAAIKDKYESFTY